MKPYTALFWGATKEGALSAAWNTYFGAMIDEYGAKDLPPTSELIVLFLEELAQGIEDEAKDAS